MFFQIALGADLISAERPSNRADIAYLFYLPFSMVFVSGDKLHRLCARPFLRADQEFLWAPELKAELARLNAEFSQFPPEDRDKGLMKFAPSPVGSDDQLLPKLWSRFMPGWRTRHASPVPISPEAEGKIVAQLREFNALPTATSAGPQDPSELDQVSIARMVPKKKGSWYLLRKDLKDRETM